MTNDHYVTRFWSGTHPLMNEGETLSDTYLEGDRAKRSAPRGTKGKLNELGSLLHRHYRFYNDGDAFTYKGERVGASSRGPRRRYYYNVENDNKMLKLLEVDMANHIEELWVLTNGATK